MYINVTYFENWIFIENKNDNQISLEIIHSKVDETKQHKTLKEKDHNSITQHKNILNFCKV